MTHREGAATVVTAPCRVIGLAPTTRCIQSAIISHYTVQPAARGEGLLATAMLRGINSLAQSIACRAGP
jgi:hypothetical protein